MCNVKSSILRILPFILFFMGQSISAVEPFSTYANSRFNNSIEYPAKLLIPRGEAPMAMGRFLHLQIGKPG